MTTSDNSLFPIAMSLAAFCVRSEGCWGPVMNWHRRYLEAVNELLGDPLHKVQRSSCQEFGELPLTGCDMSPLELTLVVWMSVPAAIFDRGRLWHQANAHLNWETGQVGHSVAFLAGKLGFIQKW